MGFKDKLGSFVCNAAEKGKQFGSDVAEKSKKLGADVAEKGKKLGSDVAEKGKKLGADIVDGSRIMKIKLDISADISRGIKDLQVYADRFPKGIVKDVIDEFMSDLEEKKKAVMKMNADDLRAQNEKIMALVSNRKESVSENEATKKMENKVLDKVYNSAAAIYHSLSDKISGLLEEYDKNKEAD